MDHVEDRALKAYLYSAIEAGEVVNLIYHGGSKPGEKREFAPIRIEFEFLWARCYQSDRVKKLFLSKIEVPGVCEAREKENVLSVDLQDVLDLAAEKNLIVEQDRGAVEIYRRLKNGNRSKRTVLALLFDDQEKRPWRLEGCGSSIGYVDQNKATLRLFERLVDY